VRACAREIAAISDRGAAEDTALVAGLLPALARLASRDLLSLGVKRQANHVPNSRFLYYDGLLTITMDEYPKGKRIPPHDHGVWEALIACTGRFQHTTYRRLDDGSREGYADLAVAEDRVLEPGDIAIVAQPAEIHSFLALEERTFAMAVVGGHYKEQRHYFNPADKTCVVRRPKAAA
jgi:predicted metal-dependent enzyme (double-stranded beta helix superfamily)